MEQLLFTKEYYYYLIALILLLIPVSLLSYQKKSLTQFINAIVLLFAIFTAFYIGNRDINIGPDTIRYQNSFLQYKDADEFVSRKDYFYDFLSFILEKILTFQQFLIFCAFIYIFGFWYGLKKIFKKDYYIPFLIFLISPYFIANGISAIRSGIAASLFIVAISVYYKQKNLKKAVIWMVVSVLFHLSMMVPMLFFLIAKYFNKTKIIFLCWLFSILLGALNINVIIVLVENLGLFEERVGFYAENEGERNFWLNFAIFGFFPVVFSVYNVLILKYKNEFYTWILNAYMLIHIPYIILLNSEYGLRLGYLAEFMMPILLAFPILIDSKIKIKFVRFKLTIILLIIFMIKAYKILIT